MPREGEGEATARSGGSNCLMEVTSWRMEESSLPRHVPKYVWAVYLPIQNPESVIVLDFHLQRLCYPSGKVLTLWVLTGSDAWSAAKAAEVMPMLMLEKVAPKIVLVHQQNIDVMSWRFLKQNQVLWCAIVHLKIFLRYLKIYQGLIHEKSHLD